MALSKRHLNVGMQLRKTVLEAPDRVILQPVLHRSPGSYDGPSWVICPSSPFLGTVLNTTLPPFPRDNSQELKIRGDSILPLV